MTTINIPSLQKRASSPKTTTDPHTPSPNSFRQARVYTRYLQIIPSKLSAASLACISPNLAKRFRSVDLSKTVIAAYKRGGYWWYVARAERLFGTPNTLSGRIHPLALNAIVTPRLSSEHFFLQRQGKECRARFGELLTSARIRMQMSRRYM